MARKKKKNEFVRFKKVNCPALNVRSEPSINALIIKVLPRGTAVECDQNFEDREWEHVTLSPNEVGFCMKQFLSPCDPETVAAFFKDPVILHSNHFECDGQVCINEESKNGKED